MPNQHDLGLSDEDLMMRVQTSDRTAYKMLADRHLGRSLAVAQRTLGNRAEAEDVVQDAFLRLWTRAATFRADRGARFSTWFYRVVVNLCIDRQRRKPTAPLEAAGDPADGRPLGDQQLWERQKSDLVAKAVAALPERQKLAIVLCYYEGLSNKDAADVMDVNIKALESLLSRARASLGQSLRPYGGEA